MAELQTLPHVEPAPPGPDLSGQIAQLQRKAERHKAALARLENTLALTKRLRRQNAEDCALAMMGVEYTLRLLAQDRVAEATFILQELQVVLHSPDPASRQRAQAAARNRDQALLTLRAKVKTLYRALAKARATIRIWHGLRLGAAEAETWALYQDAPEMREINRALGE